MSGRKLATIRIISELEPIEGADFIEIAKIDGWQVVIKKGEFNVNDKILYLEVDSWVPHELAPFLCKTKDPKEYMGIKGERLRTIKLKGALSQGLVLDPHKIMSHDQAHLLPIGTDMTERLNIQLYENPVAACLAGQVRGSFPSFIPKTDQERCLSGNTLVNTDKGLKTIKEVCENYKDVKVLSYNESEEIEEYKEVEEVSILNNNNDWYEVKTELGKCINITSNHPVFLPILCCYRKVEDLKVGDYLLDKTE